MKRFLREQDALENLDDDEDDDDENDITDEEETTDSRNQSINEKSAVQRRKSVVVRPFKTGRLKSRGQPNPIYGVGVVFYLDHYGRIQGIMSWGLPFADKPGEDINIELLTYMEHLIQTNAGVSALDAEENHQVMNIALGKASQKLVAIAVKGHLSDMTRMWHGLDGPIERFATPLYRYTEVSTSKNKTVNVLKRKGGSGLGVLGEGLYARDEFKQEEVPPSTITENSELSFEDGGEEEQPSNIPTTMYPIKVHPMYQDSKPISADTVKELNRFLAVQSWWEANENRARPGKEDPLWLRPGDEKKNTSGKQMLNDAFRRVMFAHRHE